jgi:hypothetical protein
MFPDALILLYIGGALVTAVNLFCQLWQHTFDRMRQTVWNCLSQFVILITISFLIGLIWPIYNIARLAIWWRGPAPTTGSPSGHRTHTTSVYDRRKSL